jgi:hypothetical protein
MSQSKNINCRIGMNTMMHYVVAAISPFDYQRIQYLSGMKKIGFMMGRTLQGVSAILQSLHVIKYVRSIDCPCDKLKDL